MVAAHEMEEKFLAKMQAQLTEQNFNNWFSPVKIMNLEEGAVVLGVPSSFSADWLKAHFLEQIVENLSELAGKAVSLKFKVMPELEKGRSNSQPGSRQEPSNRIKAIGPAACGLSGKYTFETFVVGTSNQFAHAASVAVADLPAKAYNPLFLYGGVGLGKTHLLNAIGHRVLAANSFRRVFYLSSERFMNELINSIRFDRMVEFREKFRSCDVLLIDDIQFISGKERTQEEFFHTFNSLYESHRQIVVSSDRFPKEIAGLEERLRSRFEWGLIADIQPPEMETRVAILTKKAQQERVSLPSEVAFFLAQTIQSNVRELEGALIRVAAFASLSGQPITVELAKQVLKDLIQEARRVISVEDIQGAVADLYHIKVVDLKSAARNKAISLPRHVAMYLTRNLTGLSFPDIGRQFGGKDHSTVIHAVRKMEAIIKSNERLKQDIETLSQALKFS